MIGQDGPDFLMGGTGNDVLIGGSGKDVFMGGNGNEVMLGGTSDSIFVAGTGNDVMEGGSGSDLFLIGTGHDVITGGGGMDTFKFTSATGAESRITDFTPGADQIDLTSAFGYVNITAQNWTKFVEVVPQSPTATTGFLEISPNGNGNFHVLAQLDGPAFQMVNGQAQSALSYNDFILPSH